MVTPVCDAPFLYLSHIFSGEFLPLGVILVLLVVATSAGRANQHQRFDQNPTV